MNMTFNKYTVVSLYLNYASFVLVHWWIRGPPFKWPQIVLESCFSIGSIGVTLMEVGLAMHPEICKSRSSGKTLKLYVDLSLALFRVYWLIAGWPYLLCDRRFVCRCVVFSLVSAFLELVAIWGLCRYNVSRQFVDCWSPGTLTQRRASRARLAWCSLCQSANVKSVVLWKNERFWKIERPKGRKGLLKMKRCCKIKTGLGLKWHRY